MKLLISLKMTRKKTFHRTALVYCLAAIFQTGCKTANPEKSLANASKQASADAHSNSTIHPGTALKQCVALRGNGDFITSHFGAISHLLESQGLIDAMAGGSSSTITMFLYESMLQNPALKDLTSQEKSIKISLLFKSILGYVNFIQDSPRAIVINQFQELRQELAKSGLLNVADSDWQRAKHLLSSLVAKSRFASILNRDIVHAISTNGTLGFKDHKTFILEVLAAAKMFGHFQANDDKIFFRPSLVDFGTFARQIGFIADFYAGQHEESQRALAHFMTVCGTDEIVVGKEQRGKTWSEVSKTQVGNSTCQKKFEDAVISFEAQFRNTNAASLHPKRLEDSIGQFYPAVAITSVIHGAEGSKEFEAAKTRYFAGENPDLRIDFDRDIRIGHWTASQGWDSYLAEKVARRNDAKASRFNLISAGTPWREIIMASPAEPSLAPAMPLGPQTISVGGWGDLHPVQILKSLGCEKVTYITRSGPETPFIIQKTPLAGRARVGVAEILGITQQASDLLYNVNDPQSSYNEALRQASQVKCSDWSQVKSGMFQEIMDEGYRSPLITGNSASVAIVGCTPIPAR